MKIKSRKTSSALVAFLILFLMNINETVRAQEINLDKELSKIESYLSQAKEQNNSVSKAPVGWHLLHSLQVINSVYNEALNSNPEDYNSKSNFKWFYVSTFGKIPRGKVKAPDAVNPSFNVTETDITLELKKVRENLKNWGALKKKNFYNHFALLHLNKRKAKRFLKIHTRHHLRIIKDILTEE